MKKVLLFIFISLFVLSCRKKTVVEDEFPKYKMGEISNLSIGNTVLPKSNMNLSIYALKSKASWCQYPDNYSLFIKHTSQNGSYEEKIIISNLSTQKAGTQKIFESGGLACDTIVETQMYIGNPDFIWHQYIPLKKVNSTITLYAYNSATKEVSGTFDMTLVNTWATADSRKIYPDTVSIRGAKFKAIIND